MILRTTGAGTETTPFENVCWQGCFRSMEVPQQMSQTGLTPRCQGCIEVAICSASPAATLPTSLSQHTAGWHSAD